MHRSLGETKHKCSAYIQSCVQCFCRFSRLVNLTLLCTPNLDSLTNSSWYQLLYSSHHLPGSCGFLTKSKNMHRVKLFDSKCTVSVNGRVSLSWPCNILATWPRCTLPLTLWQLGLAPVPPPPDHPNYPNLELDKQKKNGLMELLQRVACTTLPHNYNTAVVRGLHPLMERPSQNLLKIYGLCLNTVSVPDLN